METIYFDHISGTPLHPLVKEKMIDHIEHHFGNPISQHRIGDKALETLEEARKKVAALIGAETEEVVFTSGGTESVNHAIKGSALALAEKGKHIITTNIEHQSVLRSIRMLMRLGFEVTSLPVDQHGIVDPAAVARAIRQDTILVSIMHANNEIGTIEPLHQISVITREHGVLLHTDAIASAGVVPVDVNDLGVDLLSMSANQFYGPPGVGALYVRDKTPVIPLIDGGIQENNLRAGMQNMPGIVGMGVAADLARQEMEQRVHHLLSLRKAFLAHLSTMEDITVNGHPTLCLPGLISVSVLGVEGESMVLMLDEKGICVSTRSACATGSLRASHVLIATGCDYSAAQGTLIFSFGAMNTVEEVDKAFGVFRDSVAFLRNMSPLYQKKVPK